MHANEYSDIFICPATRKKLRLATERELEALKQREGLAKIEGAWIRSDRAMAYPVIRGIPLLVAANAISLRKSPKKQDTSNP
ncbi:MAG: hypothetical protein ACO3GO_01380 [Terrimicrobiaceae bacterium]